MTRYAILICYRHMGERVRKHWWSLRGKRGLFWYQTMSWPAHLSDEPATSDVWEMCFREMAARIPCERCGHPLELGGVATRP